MNPETFKKWRRESARNLPCAIEKLGLTRAVQIVEHWIHKEKKKEFEKRYAGKGKTEGNMGDETLQKINKDLRIMAAGGEGETEIVLLQGNDQSTMDNATLVINLCDNDATIIKGHFLESESHSTHH